MKKKEEIHYHEAIKTLYKIQEYELTIAEAEIMHQESKRAELRINMLREKVSALKACVPEEIINRYERFKPNNLPAVVDMIHGNKCSSCHVSISVGNLPRMQADKIAPICQNCGKYIYVWKE
jgi:predicted  nucleic acid-binding Zn-ribbon protein